MYYNRYFLFLVILKLEGQKMSNIEGKTAIEKEYDEQYKMFVKDLVELKQPVLIEETLRVLVLKHDNKLKNLAVVYIQNDSEKGPVLMYHLGGDIFFSLPYYYNGNTFYLGQVVNGVEIVRKVNHGNENVTPVVLECLAKKKEGEKETIFYCKNDNIWIFKCQYCFDENLNDVKGTIFEVVQADDFKKATEKVFKKLSILRLEPEIVFLNFTLWLRQEESFIKMAVAQKDYRERFKFVNRIYKSILPSSNFVFIMS